MQTLLGKLPLLKTLVASMPNISKARFGTRKTRTLDILLLTENLPNLTDFTIKPPSFIERTNYSDFSEE